MTSIDQVPPSKPDNEPHNIPQGHPAGTEFVNNTGSQTIFGDENVPSYANPTQQIIDRPHDTKNTKKRAIFITAGSLATLAVVSFGAREVAINVMGNSLANTLGANEDTSDGSGTSSGIDFENNTATLEQSAEINLAALTPDEFLDTSSISRNQQVEYSRDTLDSMREESLSDLKKLGYDLNPSIASDDNDDSQALLDLFTVDSYSAWKIAQTNANEGIKDLAGSMNPNNSDNFNLFQKNYLNGGAPVVYTGEVTDWSDNFYKDDFHNVESNGAAMRVVTATIEDGSSTVDRQITFRKDGGKWTVQKMVAYEDDDFIVNMYQFNLNITK